MKLILYLLLFCMGTAYADPHPHDGGETALSESDIVNVDINSPVTIDAPVMVEVPVDARSTNTNSVEIESERQAPGIGLFTPSDSIGLGVTTPVGGFMLNLPWSFGDRKKLEICDRLVHNSDSWKSCICLTSTMKKLHGKNQEKCVESLGGGSESDPKPSDDDTYTITGEPLGYVDDPFYIAQVDPEVEELQKVVGDLVLKLQALEDIQEEAAKLEAAQRQVTRTRRATDTQAAQVEQEQQQQQQQQQQQVSEAALARYEQIRNDVLLIERIPIPEKKEEK